MSGEALPSPVADRPLGHPHFRRYLLTRTISRCSAQMLAVAVGWQIYDLTHSAKALGFVGLAQFLPMLLLTLPAGHAADQFDRRRVVSICQFASFLALALLAWATITNHVTATAIFVLVAAIAALRAFENPPLSALLPAMVPTDLFPAATALVTSASQTAIMVGPALGGLVYGIAPFVPYALCAAGYALSAGLMMTLPPGPKLKKHSATLQTVFAGIAFIRSRPAVLGAVSLDLFAVLLGGATALMPIYARDILHAGSFGLGLLRAAPAIGALLLSIVLSRYAMRRRLGMKMFAAVIVFGLATILFGVSRSLPLSIFALIILGMADVISVMVRQVLVQLQTPDEMRGRVGAVNSLFIGTSNQLGEFESGMTAWIFGTVPAVILGGAGTIVIALLWMRLFPQLRDMNEITLEHNAAR